MTALRKECVLVKYQNQTRWVPVEQVVEIANARKALAVAQMAMVMNGLATNDEIGKMLAQMVNFLSSEA